MRAPLLLRSLFELSIQTPGYQRCQPHQRYEVRPPHSSLLPLSGRASVDLPSPSCLARRLTVSRALRVKLDFQGVIHANSAEFGLAEEARSDQCAEWVITVRALVCFTPLPLSTNIDRRFYSIVPLRHLQCFLQLMHHDSVH